MSLVTSTSPSRATRSVLWATAALVAATALAHALVVLRADRAGQEGLAFAFLGWNLFLAWIPFVVALVMAVVHVRRGPGWVLAPLGVLWLLFLPNAPYLLTDFIHLGVFRGVPLWFDAALIGTFAATGLALGLLSLLVVHRIVAQRLGGAAGWVFATAALLLSSVGVYLGRFPRFNSWDVLADPTSLVSLVLARAADPLGNPFLVRFVIAMSVLQLGSYALTWFVSRGVLGRPRRALDRGALAR